MKTFSSKFWNFNILFQPKCLVSWKEEMTVSAYQRSFELIINDSKISFASCQTKSLPLERQGNSSFKQYRYFKLQVFLQIRLRKTENRKLLLSSFEKKSYLRFFGSTKSSKNRFLSCKRSRKRILIHLMLSSGSVMQTSSQWSKLSLAIDILLGVLIFLLLFHL